ncbi:MAG: hypothetical protein ABIH69_06180 [bacterium]
MLRQIILSIIILFSLLRPALAAPNTPLLFIELWNNAAFYDTNIEKKSFSSILGRFEGKVGLNVLDLPMQVYGVYYGVSSQTNDYWDNYLHSGAGVRIMPLREFKSETWTTQWLKGVKIYAETLSASYLKYSATAESLAKTDLRYGVEVWHTWNTIEPTRALPWGELWMNLSLRQSNFGWTGDQGFADYVFSFQPKVGLHLREGIGVYLRTDITTSGKSGADYYFLNVADYGVGIRFEPWQNIGNKNDLFRNFKMYAEVLGVSYLKEKPADPVKTVTSDVRLGVEFSYGR